MRKYAAAALAIPVLATLYVPLLLRRSVALRVVLGIGLVGLLGLGLLAISSPRPTAAKGPAGSTILDASSFAETVDADHGLHAPATIRFASAMNRASVATALSVDPATAVNTTWDAAGKTLTISPKQMWQAGTYYTIKVATTAVDTTGQAIAQPARALFSTRAPTTAHLALTHPSAGGASTSTGFTVSFSQAVNPPAAAGLLQISPAVSGSLTNVSVTAAGTSVTFQPAQPLAADTSYTIAVTSGLVDHDGAPVALPLPLRIKTAVAPAIVRFRPVNGTTAVVSSAKLSVRFTQPMDTAASGPAFSAAVGGKVLAGKVTWAEGNTVLVFSPSVPLAKGSTVTMTVSTAARSAAGVSLASAGTVSFRTVAPAAAPAATKTSSKSTTTTTHKSGGSSVGSGAWHAVEVYYLGLMNCTRGGGWVLASGKCSSPGGSGIKPLILNAGISNKVSRPYAKLLATRNICTHFADGNPGDRLHRTGYPGDYRENIGCRDSSNPYASVLGTHLFFQDEKPCSNYCHWANIMDSRMTQVGIGVWVIGDRVRLVVDFWKG